MADLKTLLELEAREFDLSSDAWDATQRVLMRRRRRRRIAASLVAVVVTVPGLAGVWIAFSPAHRGISPGTSSTGSTMSSASPTAQGPLIGKIVVAGGGGIPQLSVVDPESSEVQDLSPSPYPQWDPAVSPDGTKIAYRGYFGLNEEDYGLFIMNADGTGVTRLTKGADGPAWSPDSSQIAFGYARDGVIQIVDADGSGLHVLVDAPPGAQDSSPAWSPDGTELAFVRLTQQKGFQIYTVNADGTGINQVTSTPGFKSHPAWSPDGRTIAFAGTLNDGPSQIYTVEAGGGTPVQLTHATEGGASPVWIDRGTRIAYTNQVGSELRTMNADGSDVATVAGVTSVAAFDWRT